MPSPSSTNSEPPSGRTESSATSVRTRRRPGQLRTASQGRRKPIPGGSGRGVPAADGLGKPTGIDRVGAARARTGVRASELGSDRGALRVEVQYAQRPAGVPGPAALRRWVRAACVAAGQSAPAPEGQRDAPARTLTVRVVGRAESRRLNRGFRGKDKPTNVLSFPASPEERALGSALGDLVVCAPVVAREAREQGKAPAAHWAHMIVHGTLHLLGHDHERPRQARAMEAVEVEILRGFGFDDPYLVVTYGRV
jgi:probable rRNA maturation factor